MARWLANVFITVALTSTWYSVVLARSVKLNQKWNHKWLRHARIRAIKQEFLNKLGMTAVPDVSNVNTTIEEKRSMLRLYKKGLRDINGKTHTLYEDDEFFAKTFHSFPALGGRNNLSQPAVWGNVTNLRFSFKINISKSKDATQETYVHSAKLKVFKLLVKPENLRHQVSIEKQIPVNVYQLLSNETEAMTNDTQITRKLLDSHIVSLQSVGWEEFDVTDAVQDWLKDPQTNFGIEVACHYQALDDLIEFAMPDYDWPNAQLKEELRPRVDVYSRQRVAQSRRKRSDEKYDCVQGDGETRCCRYPLWISFKHIGWSDWVVAPEGYLAYYCDGRCPYRYKLAHTFAAIQSLINKINPAAAPAPCCTAAKLSPITLLHYNNKGRLVVSVYEDMVIDECMCA